MAVTVVFLVLVPLPGPPLTSYLFLRQTLGGALELAVAVGLGLLAARRIGLGAPLVESLLRAEPMSGRLRAILAPSLVIGVAVAIVRLGRNVPPFHPHRDAALREAQRLSESPAVAKALEALGTPHPLTTLSLTVGFIYSAINAELLWRLGLLSLLAWLFGKLARSPARARAAGLLWGSNVAVALTAWLYYVTSQWMHREAFLHSLGGLQFPLEPFWLMASRALVVTVPADLAFGWLYFRRGLESAMLGHLTAQLVEHILIVLVVVHLV